MPDRVAVITDIRANLPALHAALARIDELGIADVHCGGDLGDQRPHLVRMRAVADEIAAGLPEEFADKLLVAA